MSLGHITRELTNGERCNWLRSTLERLASMPRLSDDDFGCVVFEDLDPDVWSCLHESSLDSFVLAGCITDPIKVELRVIRSSFFALVEAGKAGGAPSLADIRRDAKWHDIARRCKEILSECVCDDAA